MRQLLYLLVICSLGGCVGARIAPGPNGQPRLIMANPLARQPTMSAPAKSTVPEKVVSVDSCDVSSEDADAVETAFYLLKDINLKKKAIVELEGRLKSLRQKNAAVDAAIQAVADLKKPGKNK